MVGKFSHKEISNFKNKSNREGREWGCIDIFDCCDESCEK